MRIVFLFFLCASLHGAQTVDELKQKVCDHVLFLEGWCSKEKAKQFIDLVLETKPRVCVEIGVFGGSSIFPVASALKFLGQGVVIGIDPWDRLECIKYFHPIEEEIHLRWWSMVNLDAIYQSYENMLKKFELEKYCITMRESSTKAVSKIDFIDILYIDGNHCEPASTLDVILYLPKVVPGGYIWLNDFSWIGLQQSVDLLLEACDPVKVIDGGGCMLFRKR